MFPGSLSIRPVNPVEFRDVGTGTSDGTGQRAFWVRSPGHKATLSRNFFSLLQLLLWAGPDRVGT